MTGVVRRAWDTDVCLAYLNDEPGRADQCERVLQAAQNGEVEIVISTLAMAEVLYLRGVTLPEEDRETIRNFFRREFIISVDVTRRIAEEAQDVVWRFGVAPKDAIHVATALYARVGELNTFDGGLLALHGRVGENPALVIREPDWGTQHGLFDEG